MFTFIPLISQRKEIHFSYFGHAIAQAASLQDLIDIISKSVDVFLTSRSVPSNFPLLFYLLYYLEVQFSFFFFPRDGPPVLSDRWLYGRQTPSAGRGEYTKPVFLSGMEPRFLGYPSRSLVTTSNELSQLI